MAIDNSVPFNRLNSVLTKTFVPSEQFDLDILKVTSAIYYLRMANLSGTKILQKASNQAVLGVLLFWLIGFTNMVIPRS